MSKSKLCIMIAGSSAGLFILSILTYILFSTDTEENKIATMTDKPYTQKLVNNSESNSQTSIIMNQSVRDLANQLQLCTGNCSSIQNCKCLIDNAVQLLEARQTEKENMERILEQLYIFDQVNASKKGDFKTKLIFVLDMKEKDVILNRNLLKGVCDITTDDSHVPHADAILFNTFNETVEKKWSLSSRTNQLWIYGLVSTTENLKNSSVYFNLTATYSFMSNIPRHAYIYVNQTIDDEFTTRTKKVVLNYNTDQGLIEFLNKVKESGINVTNCIEENCTNSNLYNDSTVFILYPETDFKHIIDYRRFYYYIRSGLIPVVRQSNEDFYKNNSPKNSYYYLKDLSLDSAKQFANAVKTWNHNQSAKRYIHTAQFFKRLCGLLHAKQILNANISE